jgi:hypothetical protein
VGGRRTGANPVSDDSLPAAAAAEGAAESKRLRPSWGEIFYRVFAEDGGRCPGCGSRMTLRAVFEGGPTTSEVLVNLRRSAAASRGPPAAVA